MAQVLKLKRTAVSGKIPSTSQLQLGELAINTHDGRIFFEKDNGTPSISEILIVNTHTPVTGSLNLNGNISATNITLSGDLVVQGTTTTIDSTNLNIGDNIIELNYGGSSTIGGIYVKDATGGSTTSGSLLWDSTNDYWKLGTAGSESQVITISNLVSNLPSGVISGSSQITITESQISDLTHTEIPSGTISGSSQLNGSTLSNMTISGSFSGSFIGDGSGLTNVVAQVTQVSTVTSDFTNQTSVTVTHNFNTKNILVSVYDENDSFFLPSSIVTTDVNSVTVGFSGIESGRVVVAKGGHIVSGSASDTSNLNGQPGSYYLDYDNFTNIPSGIVSGSSQITSLTTYKEDVSGNSTYTITHNLNEEYPIVQAWNTSTKRQEIPSIIESTSVNAFDITFSGTFSGRIIVKK
jgi:hypothetical protein